MNEGKRFDIIECKGSSYDIGYQYGNTCKQSIEKSIKTNFEALNSMYNASKKQIISIARKYLPLVKKFSPSLIERLKGTAEGAEKPFDIVFAVRIMLELDRYYGRFMGLCTSFAATGKATRNGKTMLGQNLDLMPGQPLDLLRVKPEKDPESITLMVGTCPWSLTSQGLGVAMNRILPPPEDYGIAIPCSILVDEAMKKRNIGNSLKVIAENGRNALNYILADKDGNIVDVETHPDGFNVIYPENGFVVHTNHFISEKFKKGDGRSKGSLADSYVRLQRMNSLMNKNQGKLSIDIMKELLTDHSNFPSSICRHRDEGKSIEEQLKTLASIIMLPEEGVLHLAPGPPCKSEYMKYKL